ncbi:MAG: UDP-N-acetylmuramoyl-L-alanine--D-glutamate ligase [Alphaproteobacteria bacterium]|nr:UDP-N-acetylmuramoyl-L-alanine--D-glutamate ligase [Alphaproteobacteria bacterium]
MLWTNLNNKRIGIWGMGKEGLSAKQAISKHAHPISITQISEENTHEILNCDIIIKSPGVSLYRPEITQAQQNGIIVTSGTNLFFANKNPNTTTIAVTGTKGKSTTSSLLAHTLLALGKKTVLGGNIGLPLVDLIDTDTDYIVAELSSYQCADFIGNPDIGVLVNLYPEHLPWHGSHNKYYQDKLNMIAQSSNQVLNMLDKNTHTYTDANQKFQNITYFNDDIHSDGKWFYDNTQQLFPCASLNLTGEHNHKNACAVLTIIKKLGLDLMSCEQAFKTFQALPHRLQVIEQKVGLTFIDDSISTTPETAIAALKAIGQTKPITLIVGGEDRGQDFSELIHYIKTHPTIYVIAMPDTGRKIINTAQKNKILVHSCSTMAEAVQKALTITPVGGVVLLSPAAPSYNMYKNFEERGADFKNNINLWMAHGK